jgi:cyclopropane fatty-acyl-phospholipid synthase-like methyltransferase
VVKSLFLDAFAALPFRRDDGELKILDVGCGLGFLSCVSAEFYKRARVTAIDTFEHDSLKGSSLKKAQANAAALGFSDRVAFVRGDVLSFTPSESFDMFVSNLVFHNLGRRRFEAYSRLSSWARAGSFALVGDLFSPPDRACLAKDFGIRKEFKPTKADFGEYALLVMSKNSRRTLVRA